MGITLQWNLYTKDAFGPVMFVLNREVSSSRRLKIHLKYKICPLYRGFLYYVLNTECPLSEVPLYNVLLYNFN